MSSVLLEQEVLVRASHRIVCAAKSTRTGRRKDGGRVYYVTMLSLGKKTLETTSVFEVFHVKTALHTDQIHLQLKMKTHVLYLPIDVKFKFTLCPYQMFKHR